MSAWVASKWLLAGCVLLVLTRPAVQADDTEEEDLFNEEPRLAEEDRSSRIVSATPTKMPPTAPPVPVMALIKRCKSQVYMPQPIEKICTGKECPRLRAGAPKLPSSFGLKCTKPQTILDREPHVSVLLLRPNNETGIQTSLKNNFPGKWHVEVVAFEDAPQGNKEASNKHKALVRQLQRHYVIYSNHKLGLLRPLNRLVKFANAETVLVVNRGQHASVALQWVESAVHALHVHPELAVVGLQGVDGAPERRSLTFMNAVALDKPMVIRRSAFLAAGLIDTSSACPEDAVKEMKAWEAFCSGLWKHGLAVAALDWEARPADTERAHISAILRNLWPAENSATMCLETTSESARGRADCPHGPDVPPGAMGVQYFKRGRNVKGLSSSFRKATPKGMDVLINDDSMTEHNQWLDALGDLPNVLLVHSPNIHEIRGYNRLGKLTNAELVGFMQDDDNAENPGWMQNAAELFKSFPKMALLGGRAGRMDTGKVMEVKGRRKIPGYMPGPLWQNDGPKYGWKFTRMTDMDPRSGIPFTYVYKVNASPLVVKRSVFLQLGMFHKGYSCLGMSGISFDFEYSVRNWKYGHRVGLFYSSFSDFDNSRSSGTWKSVNAVKNRMVTWRRNNLMIYYMYPNFHHRVGTQLPVEANKETKLTKISCSMKRNPTFKCKV